MPALAGNGLAMRAGMVLEALAADHDVHLLVIAVHGHIRRRDAPPEVSRWCADVAVVNVAHRHEHPLFRLIGRTTDPRERLAGRSEEHTSELQSLRHLVCRLLLEKKKNNNKQTAECN